MRTPEQMAELRAALTKARISCSSPRAHRAARLYEDGDLMESTIEFAVTQENAARQMWIETALDPWCERHGLTRAQGLSVAFNDHEFNVENPSKDLVTLKTLFQWSGQQNDFAAELFHLEREMADSGERDSTSSNAPGNAL